MKIKDFFLKTWKLYKKYFISLILIYLTVFLRDNYIKGPSGFLGITFHVFILHIFGSAIFCYLIKLWKDESGQVKNFVRPFTEPEYRLKIWVVLALSTAFVLIFVFAAMSLLNTNTDDFVAQLLLFGIIYGAYRLFISVIDRVVEIIIAVFILYPQGSPFKTFFKGLEYNLRYFIPYCIFDFVLMIIPNKLADILAPHIGGIYIALIVSPLIGFVFLAKAGFLYEKITFKEKSKAYSKYIATYKDEVYSKYMSEYKDIDNLYKSCRYKLILIFIVVYISTITILYSTSWIAAILFIFVTEPLLVTLSVKKSVEKVDKILFDDCDPIKYLDLVEYGTKEKKNFFDRSPYKFLYSRLFTANIALERYDVVEQLLEKEKKNSANYKIFKSDYELLKAIAENNAYKYIYVYEHSPKKLKKLKPFKCRYLMAQGKRQEAFELITSYTEPKRYNEIGRQKALADYYIIEGNIEEARKYMQFIADNANKLPVQKRAEKWLADNGYGFEQI